jgi:uncharacterized membrane protein YbhN (UPF0104 family)
VKVALKRERLIRILIGIAPAVILGILGYQYLDELWRLECVPLYFLPMIFMLYITARFVTSVIMWMGVRRAGCRISVYTGFSLVLVASYSNLLIPKIGFGPVAVFLKGRYGLRYADFSTILVPVGLFQLPTIGVLGMLLQAILSVAYGIPFEPVIGFGFALCIAGPLMIMICGAPVPGRWQGRVPDFCRRVSHTWHKLCQDQWFLVKVFALHILVSFLRALRLGVAFQSLGLWPGFFQVWFVSLLGDLMLLASFTPSGLGLREAVIAYGSHQLGVDPSMAITVAVLDRLVWSVGLVPAAQVGLWWLAKVKSRGDVAE